MPPIALHCLLQNGGTSVKKRILFLQNQELGQMKSFLSNSIKGADSSITFTLSAKIVDGDDDYDICSDTLVKDIRAAVVSKTVDSAAEALTASYGAAVSVHSNLIVGIQVQATPETVIVQPHPVASPLSSNEGSSSGGSCASGGILGKKRRIKDCGLMSSRETYDEFQGDKRIVLKAAQLEAWNHKDSLFWNKEDPQRTWHYVDGPGRHSTFRLHPYYGGREIWNKKYRDLIWRAASIVWSAYKAKEGLPKPQYFWLPETEAQEAYIKAKELLLNDAYHHSSSTSEPFSRPSFVAGVKAALCAGARSSRKPLSLPEEVPVLSLDRLGVFSFKIKNTLLEYVYKNSKVEGSEYVAITKDNYADLIKKETARLKAVGDAYGWDKISSIRIVGLSPQCT